jgi:hypothetical protein
VGRDRTNVQSRDWANKTRNVYWIAGNDPSAIADRVTSIVQHDVKSFEMRETSLPKCQYGRLRHEFKDRTIIGARLENCWKSSTNASWRLLDGWTSEHSMEVEFSTQHYRGGHWRFEVWSVADGLCQS